MTDTSTAVVEQAVKDICTLEFNASIGQRIVALLRAVAAERDAAVANCGQVIADTAVALGCAADNEAILLAIHTAQAEAARLREAAQRVVSGPRRRGGGRIILEIDVLGLEAALAAAQPQETRDDA